VTRRRRRSRDQRGQTSVLIIGMATFLALLVVVVVDATAAYLQRQSLATLADGAALRGADLGATGVEVYSGGIEGERLRLSHSQASRSVGAYLRETGAYGRFPGLSYVVSIDPGDRRVNVSLRAPLDLPLRFPGSPERTTVGATGSAVVAIEP
jgi:hypothetical protein